ncbi:MAG: DUF3096 domain-containing protein [Balneolales bacterium]|nr:DUF3096 domain-containing protein [Balneolales bacterium]
MQSFFINTPQANPVRKVTNGIIALITGLFTLAMPEMLTVIVAAYLISNGIDFFFYRNAGFVGGVSVFAGIIIYTFPNFVPYAFALFLFALAFGTILSGGLSLLGLVAFGVALVIISTETFFNQVIASFLTFYGIMSILTWWQLRKLQNS